MAFFLRSLEPPLALVEGNPYPPVLAGSTFHLKPFAFTPAGVKGSA